MREGQDFASRPIASIMGSFGDAIGFHFWPSADVGLMRTIADTMQDVFAGTCGHFDEVGSVAERTEADQVASVTSRTFDTMADARHRCWGCMLQATNNLLRVSARGKMTKSGLVGVSLRACATKMAHSVVSFDGETSKIGQWARV